LETSGCTEPGPMHPMPFEQVKRILESLLIVADAPLTIEKLRGILPEVGAAEIRRVTEALNEEYEKTGRAFRIAAIAGGFQIATLPEYGAWVEELRRDRPLSRLSPSALETLAIVAFKQPVIRPEIEAIRGVNTDGVIRTLLERHLIKITGRSSTPGRPLLYGTTKEFLRHFGLNSVSELPRPEEMRAFLSEKEQSPERAAESVPGSVGNNLASEGG